MKMNQWIARLIVAVLANFTMLTAQAGLPLWSFTPLTATTIIVEPGTTGVVQYLVTNNSSRTHTLAMTPITGITQLTGGSNCSNPFILGFLGSCVLSLQFDANVVPAGLFGGPAVCDFGSTLQCYQPSLADSLNITVAVLPPQGVVLSSSVSVLALSVNNTTLNPALTGNPRLISITNNSATAATNVNYTVSPALPSGASITPASCGTILPGGSCTLTVTPGQNQTISPVTVTIQGDNTNTLTPTINIITYGSNYEGGFLFSVDDTTPNTSSVGGKVTALADQSTGILWSSNGSGGFDGGVSIFGISELSSTGTPDPSTGQISGQSPCNGASDGVCDTINIVTWYVTPNTSPSINPAFYAAGLCTQPINGFSDWYLPSICEAGYDNTSTGSGCGTQVAPAMQNMQSNLVDNGNIGSLTGLHWTSTEGSVTPTTLAWQQNFQTAGASLQTSANKGLTIASRCVRVLT
ncbi:MAG: DUF1566 domain-containing protein [Pseudomonadota bacterium]